MRDDDQRLEIARSEAADTFQSITDLDGISDTAIVGITFLLTALVTWTSFAYERIEGEGWLTLTYLVVTAGCVLASLGSVYFLVNALSPRAFYGDGVGARYLDHGWLLWRNDDPVDLDRFSRADGGQDPGELAESVDAWIDRYEHGGSIESHEEFTYARLLNYKCVARLKAHHNAYGMALLRVAVVLLGVLVVLGLFGPLLAQ